MTLSNDYLNSVVTKPLTRSIIPLHPIVEEKSAIPSRLWKSLKKWKAKLRYIEQEGQYIQKMAKWHGVTSRPCENKECCIRLEKLLNEQLPILLKSIQEIETEILTAIMDNEGGVKAPFARAQKLEKELKQFRKEVSTLKLEVLNVIANNSRITFF